RKHELQQELERRRLAGAVRAEEAEHFAGANLDGETIERAMRAKTPEADCVVFGEVAGLDGGSHRTTKTSKNGARGSGLGARRERSRFTDQDHKDEPQRPQRSEERWFMSLCLRWQLNHRDENP